jgi:hypothetical protein
MRTPVSLFRARPARRAAVVTLAVLAASAAALASDTPVLTSRWSRSNVQIDGINHEWQALTELPDGPAMAVANDDQFLDLIVATSDQGIRRDLSSGVILWFDPSADKKQSFGIGISAPTEAGRESMAHTAPQAPPREGELIAPPTVRSADIVDSFDLYGPDKERRQIRLDSALGVRVARAVHEGMLAFELELPLVKTAAHPYAVGAVPGAAIDLGLTTPARSNAGTRGGRVPPGGGGLGGSGTGFGGIGRGGSTGGGFFGPRRGYDPGEAAMRYGPLKIWARLEIAVRQ